MDDGPFIAEILTNPYDDGPRLVYADWLDEQGDARGEFLRREIAAPPQDLAVIRRAFRLDRTWVTRVGKRYDVILLSSGSDDNRGLTTALKQSCCWSVQAASHLAQSAPVKILRAVSCIAVYDFLRRVRQLNIKSAHVEVHPAPCPGYSDIGIENAEIESQDWRRRWQVE